MCKLGILRSFSRRLHCLLALFGIAVPAVLPVFQAQSATDTEPGVQTNGLAGSNDTDTDSPFPNERDDGFDDGWNNDRPPRAQRWTPVR